MALTFKGIDAAGFGGYAFTDQLLYNVKWWLDWGLLHHGAYGIVNIGEASLLNSDESVLQNVHDERYMDGQVWNGFGREWIWESGVAVAEPPFRVSGIYISSEFHPLNETGPYSHHVDYQNGRVVFDVPQDPSATIQAAYCHRLVNVAPADHPEFRELMQLAIQEFTTATAPSGTPTREHQIWLPAVFIDVERGRQRGLELGGGQIKTRNVVLHIFADRVSDRNLLADWLDLQSRAAFDLADLNSVTLPFDSYGAVVSGVTNWPDMAAQYPWKKLRIMDGEVTRLPSVNPNMFRARVMWETEVDFAGV